MNDYLIKLLGGHTQQDYDFACSEWKKLADNQHNNAISYLRKTQQLARQLAIAERKIKRLNTLEVKEG
jgi:hypothetical protein